MTLYKRLTATSRRHAPFLVVLAVGLGLRVVTQLAYWPALLFEDSYHYLANSYFLDPGAPRPVGYSVFLRALLYVPDLAVVPIVQHLMGLAMGVLTYTVLLRFGVRRWLATLAAIPILWDAYELQIEQMVMSDTLFDLLLLGGLTVLAWRRAPASGRAAVAGLVLGLAVPVRLVGQILVLPAVLVTLAKAPGWRRRVGHAALLLVTFVAPVVGYAAWYHHGYGTWGLSDMGGRVRYARVAGFVDCSAISFPSYERPLCPGKPPAKRLVTNAFVWSPESPARVYTAPPGMGKDAILKDFARRVMLQQPLDYLGVVGRDFLKGFAPRRRGYPGDVPVSFWQFQTHYRTYRHDTAAVVDAYGGEGPYVNKPLASFLRAYQLHGGYTSGAVLGFALLAGLAGTVGLGRARRSGVNAACFLYTVTAVGLLLAAATYEFSWRYQLPGVTLLPVAGALGLAALLEHGRHAPGNEQPRTRPRQRAPAVLARTSRHIGQ
ncbi:MAG: hypothetical protein ACRDN9_13345 [Streptosporangiaceae bacterium]